MDCSWKLILLIAANRCTDRIVFSIVNLGTFCRLCVASGASVISDHNTYGNILFLYGHSDTSRDWHKESSLTKKGAVQSPAPSWTRDHGETNNTTESKKEVESVEEGRDNRGEKGGARTSRWPVLHLHYISVVITCMSGIQTLKQLA